MDLKTSFAFYFVSLTLYLIVLTAMAVADKRVLGTRWLAYSVLIEMIKIGLQGMGDRIPLLWSTTLWWFPARGSIPRTSQIPSSSL